MKITVIIPTYNEAGAIGGLIYNLEKVFKEIPSHDFNILVVDADSKDQTPDIVNEAQKKYKNIEILAEPIKRGLGAAYIYGMKHAISKFNSDAIIEFDGDFQHNPEDVKRLICEFDNGFDYVIGSRYVRGGTIPEEWSGRQKFLSKYGSWFIMKTLNLPTHDNTSGLRLSRVAGFYDKLPLDENKILSLYHAYKIHLLCEMLKLGAKTKEIPIKFLERRGGDSKSTVRDIFESLKVVSILKVRDFLGK
ncbi:hypothetical protein A3H65_03990 [Candidatus Giovannonibacteria bacterium RIFCSPLOWO2_02_FULL_45_14]|uniref:Glycosyltransferase 2-like domain-containing protein n=1 Tax=Candidatus Giovannonibacteria bacterium RIFCSPLOWO2_12_FULL_44_15 TaxID=1798364 RepID=A0A1F5Y111_9BACT|nr:MAG: hypothetical protein A3C75_03190 [Candidatus Giovannonibacteria bacterium RIFCSPHIGHO2_02_FULL_44_31]OGF76650.1 MAG: hypothetical protein A3E62_03400 [Candidatus Giovannonibacteria bacterium RIFCSPHIGHO2_12_FULL_44_29]OGF91224.1 MAG: hypothetical protein A3H65_03990 [Candidatus Giovannonibacteria bacterium RIFCSPLOWO2_02_FULL_45_14]OGF93736.1 MAG: hypothetical protein A3G54_04260 [Candidatus Giovannonibacteria bacterium RIFCSPLOWO2_12_FULL_44_15]